MSSFLILSTLFSCFAPVHSCFAAGKGRCQRPAERYNVRRCSGPARPIDIKDEAALKQAILELAKDKKFTDQIVKNYEKAHEDPFLLKLIKLPFKVVYKIICKLFDYTVGYWIGEKLCTAVEKFIINYVVPILGACYLYNNSDWFKKRVNSFISYLNPSNQTDTKTQEKND